MHLSGTQENFLPDNTQPLHSSKKKRGQQTKNQSIHLAKTRQNRQVPRIIIFHNQVCRCQYKIKNSNFLDNMLPLELSNYAKTGFEYCKNAEIEDKYFKNNLYKYNRAP